MKGFKVIFAVCLALLGIGSVWATESDDAVRAATRRGTTNTVTSNRQKSDTPTAQNTPGTTARIINSNNKQAPVLRERSTTQRTKNNVSTASRTSDTKQLSPRATTNVASRATRAPTPHTATRTSNVSRSATRTPTQKTRQDSTATRSAANRTSVSRSAINTNTENLRDTVMNANHKECREIFYNCMDEFCANKDTQLKRCACSSRLHEFDSVKKQLDAAEEKMLDFSQRLLTVSMDAEDAAALNVATEGELAFNQKDTSESKKILDEITYKLNTKFEDDSFDRNLTAISLSLNEDAAFDNVDSLMGASTTLKTGTALYGAALPVCREMAAEVCTPDQLSIAESGYQMMIEQDCNTVKKSYQSQTDSARAKILENSALLDMSRLDKYQDKNSDDILTCKRKMLDMLSDTSVCGENLSKCLDTTGQYIDPSTGEAFLTVNLANLTTLITRPTANQTWTDMPGNERFVQHLQSKKKYLEPAMEHCQDIADSVWNGFIEDALAQIKLAQDAKLEEVRQSCTTLTTQCLSETAASLSDFDARALSTFGVIADTTVNAMCADVKNACTALMEATGDGQTDWAGGMTEIATDTTYDTIIQTCREVGRACIIQACKSISGNFGLCENIDTSVNRKAIINGTSCWQEVLDCVADAGADSIERIMAQLVERNDISDQSADTPAYSFYHELYDYTKDGTLYKAMASSTNSGYDEYNCSISGTDNQPEIMRCVYDQCVAKRECTSASDTTTKCKTCRLAERIWGHCELPPSRSLMSESAHNTIVAPSDANETTLLYWFALNTGTEALADSCRDTSCGPGYILDPASNTCFSRGDFTNDGLLCKETEGNESKRMETVSGEANCCETGKDSWDNCCGTNGTIQSITIPGTTDYYPNGVTNGQSMNICIPSGQTVQYVLTFTASNSAYYGTIQNLLVCLGTVSGSGNTNGAYPSGDTLSCSGQYLLINTNTGMYFGPEYTNAQLTTSPTLSYIRNDGATVCTLKYDTTAQTWQMEKSGDGDCNMPNNYKISY